MTEREKIARILDGLRDENAALRQEVELLRRVRDSVRVDVDCFSDLADAVESSYEADKRVVAALDAYDAWKGGRE
jgi:hypothetical protein